MTVPSPSPHWTLPQRRAIDHPGGDLLVSAAAGSGKTAVLAERCARLVCEEGPGACGIENLLVLTFTDAAANEMRERIAKAIRARLTDGQRRSPDRARWLKRQAAMVDRAAISTLHAFCARTLRQHFAEAGIDPAFELMDEEEARLIRDEALDDLLARWHALTGSDAQPFADFFEAYAQGSDSHCRDMILRLHHMLASTADPAAYIAQSRSLYHIAPGLPGTAGGGEAGGGGMEATPPDDSTIPPILELFLHETIGEKLRLLLLTAERACSEVRERIGAGPMIDGLDGALQTLQHVQKELIARGAAALPDARAALAAFSWPNLKTLKEVAGFDDLKKRTWVKVKDKMRELAEQELAVDLDHLSRDLATLGPSLETLLALVADFQQTYAAAKRARNRLDFSDLERLTLDLLTRPGSAAGAELRARYCHLLVDEFQDINPLQAALLHAVRSADRFEGQGNLFVVGDVKQAIYGFRLAQPELFLQRERAAREEAMGGGSHIALPHNFRSHPPLLAAMNGLFEKLLTLEIAGIRYPDGHALEAPPPPDPPIKNQKSKIKNPLAPFTGAPLELHLVAMKSPDDDPSDDATPDPPPENLSATEEEAQLVARRIRTLLAESRAITLKDGSIRPLAYRDIAILLRTMKNKATLFARALAQHGIPVHADLSTGYFDTPEVRDTLALLQVLDNPQQDIPLATLLLGPYGRFSHDDLATLRLTFDRQSVSFAEAVRRYPLFGETTRSGIGDGGREVPPFDPALAARLRTLFTTLDRWRGFLRTRPLHEGLAAIYAESKILPYVAALEGGTQRTANLQALHQRALKFSGFSKQGLHRFLRFIEKLRDQDGDFGEAPVLSEASDVVRILSIHKSKGLEFPVVIVAGLGAPSGRPEGGAMVLHRDWGVGLQRIDIERNLSYPTAASLAITAAAKRAARAEEFRLLYVAMTRAREHLILTGHLADEHAVAKLRDAWCLHPPEKELPEDTLMTGRVFLDWILPALACGRLRVDWNTAGDPSAEVAVALHAPTGAARAAAAAAPEDPLRDALLAGTPLPSSTTHDPVVDQLMQRLAATYAHQSLTTEPAVRTVSELKKIEDNESVPMLRVVNGGGGEEALQRGTATHRVLELLDFSQCGDNAEMEQQILSFIANKKISAEDAGLADREGIEWFLRRTEAGRRLCAAARGQHDVKIHREIPFNWVAPLAATDASPDPADWPTIRGTIDLLLVNSGTKNAEIIDYKTDSPATWRGNLPAYEKQMRYYLRAAAELLGFPVEKATLLFLTAKEAREVRAT